VGHSPEFLDQLRRRVALAELVRRHGVKLVRRGREYAGLCPFHREKTPSFYVVEDQRFFHCFGCGAHGDAIGFLMRIENVDFRSAVEQLAGRRGEAVAKLPSDRAGPLVPLARRDKDERNRRIALRMWQNAAPARGSPVEKYLRSRGLALPPAPVLRFAPRCWNRETGRELPAMLARVDDINGELVAVHRTWLRADGSGKAALQEPKWSLGPIGGAAVRLAPAGPVLAVAEGIENALTAIAAGYAAWSGVSAGGMQSVVLPRMVEKVLIVADHDANGVGQRAARKAADRWLAEGRQVRIAPTRLGEDLNDALIRSGGGSERRAQEG
jgi:DNA primase